MKLFIGFLLGFAVLIGTVGYVQSTSTKDKEQADADQRRYDNTFREASARMQADIMESKAKMIGLKFGPIAGMEYPRCGSAQLKKNQDLCKQWNAYLKKVDEDEDKHPSW